MQHIHNKIIAFFTFIGGLYFFLEFVLPADIRGFKFGFYHDDISNGVQVIGLMAIGLGIINIFRVHGLKLLKRQSGWVNSLVLLGGLLIVFYFQIIDLRAAEKKNNFAQELENFSPYIDVVLQDYETQGKDFQPRLDALVTRIYQFKKMVRENDLLLGERKQGDDEMLGEPFLAALDSILSQTEELRLALLSHKDITTVRSKLKQAIKSAAPLMRELLNANYEAVPERKASNFIFNAFFAPLGSAMFSLLAFYIVTAAYRSFRIRSLEALVMMIPALIVMLGQIPHGPLYVSNSLPELRRWLLEYLNTPAFRAIFFGSTIAGLAMALRMWLSLEKSPLQSDASIDTKN